MKYQIENGIEIIRRPTKKKEPIYPLGNMKVGESIVIQKNYTEVGDSYRKKYQNITGRIVYIKKRFDIVGKFKIGVDKDMNLRILKIA